MTSQKYEVSLVSIAEEFRLHPEYVPADIEKRTVSRSDISRPGLPLTGFYKDFENARIQIIGNMENSYLRSLTPEQRKETMDLFFSHRVPMVIITAGQAVFPEVLEAAKAYETPLYTTDQYTSSLLGALTSSLNVSLAERITTHGVLVEVYGEGILILGESGIGKSETAIELVKRGHRLIADDAVLLRRVSDRSLVGSAPEAIRHYVELRGIGIIDVRRIFGMGAVKETEKVDLCIHFEPWDSEKQYERLGLETQYTELLGLQIPSITIPVRPGRNLAVIIEIAAMNNRQKKMGYNTAEELTRRLEENYAQNKNHKNPD
ncbi:MAG: HPr(Ser) kinase/phosphatase [Clostridia bacterium]|nr:HPr(Ser) kinase/phosphatase [Clostridia bacterium]